MNLRPAVAVIPHVASNPTSFGSPPIYAWSFSSRRVKIQPRSSCAGSPYPCHRPSVNDNTFRSSNMAGKSMKFSWENPPISVDFHKNRMIQKKKEAAEVNRSSGNPVGCEISLLKIVISIVDFPINSMVILPWTMMDFPPNSPWDP